MLLELVAETMNALLSPSQPQCRNIEGTIHNYNLASIATNHIFHFLFCMVQIVLKVPTKK